MDSLLDSVQQKVILRFVLRYREEMVVLQRETVLRLNCLATGGFAVFQKEWVAVGLRDSNANCCSNMLFT